MLTKTDHNELVGLRESVEKYRKMLDLAPDAIITVDPLTGRILEVNQKAIELTGYGTEELIGIEIGELHPQQEREAVRRLLREVENNGSGALTNLHFCRKDGTSLAIEVSANMISFGSKHLIQQVCHDVTARNQLVEQNAFFHSICKRILEMLPRDRIVDANRSDPSGLFQTSENLGDIENLKRIIQNSLTSKSLNDVLMEKIHELDQTLRQRDEITTLHKKLRDELALARKVQESMLPQDFDGAGLIKVSAKYLPAFEVGGDFYDVIRLQGDRIGVLVTDVTGHGVQAGLSTALIKVAFSAYAGSGAGPGDILAGMNAVLRKGLPAGMLAAALVVTINTKTGQCHAVNGGIPYPILLHRDTCQVEKINVNGLLLGFAADEVFESCEEVSFQLAERDCLILYTDGLSEIENEAGEHFAVAGMGRALVQWCSEANGRIVDHLIDTARQHGSPSHNWDDIAIVTIEREAHSPELRES